MNYSEFLRKIGSDLKVAISLATILPVGPMPSIQEGDVARASWALPVAGLLVGLAGAACYSMARGLGLATNAAAMLALVATILATGAMHEDGLADAIDGLGGGGTRERKLEIMRDSRIGTFGTCAIIASLILRWCALMSLAEPRLVAIALPLAHAGARAGLPAFMHLVPPARSDGLSAWSGRPTVGSAAVGCGLGAACVLLGLGPSKSLIVLISLLVAGLAMAWLVTRQIGGQTGDVLGAFEQIGEILILLIVATLLQREL